MLFVCVHNAGRSQKVAGFRQHLAGNQPSVLTRESAQAPNLVVTMGCGDECPYFPGKRDEEWTLDDPAGLELDAVRRIRDEIKERVRTLLESLMPD